MRRVGAIIGLVLSVLVLAWAAWSWWSPPPEAPGLPTGAAPSVSASGRATPAGTPSATQVLRVELPAAGYAQDARTMEIADSGVINPPDFQHMWWIRDRGTVPNSNPSDTAYLACHTNAAKATSVVPCNQLSLENTQPGSAVHVATDTEQLTYTVTSTRKVLRDDFASDRAVWDINPGRLVVISCFLSEGRRTDYNIVVIAELNR